MGWYAKKGERSQMLGLWEMFTVCKMQKFVLQKSE